MYTCMHVCIYATLFQGLEGRPMACLLSCYLMKQLPRKVPEFLTAAVENLFCQVTIHDPYCDLENPGI